MADNVQARVQNLEARFDALNASNQRAVTWLTELQGAVVEYKEDIDRRLSRIEANMNNKLSTHVIPLMNHTEISDDRLSSLESTVNQLRQEATQASRVVSARGVRASSGLSSPTVSMEVRVQKLEESLKVDLRKVETRLKTVEAAVTRSGPDSRLNQTQQAATSSVTSLQARVDQIEADVRVLKAGSAIPPPQSDTATPAASVSSAGGATGAGNILSPFGATGTSSPSVSGGSVRSSPPGQTAWETLSSEEFERVTERSWFSVQTRSSRPLQHTVPTVIDGYDKVWRDSDCMNRRTGVYTTPVTGKYRFMGGKLVSGTCGLYLCGSDGRREEMVVEWDDDDGGWVGHEHVYWHCDQGMEVWLEAQASRPGVGLQVVRFVGELEEG